MTQINFVFTPGKWQLVFQCIDTPQLYHKRTIRFFFTKAYSDILCPGYKIVQATKLPGVFSKLKLLCLLFGHSQQFDLDYFSNTEGQNICLRCGKILDGFTLT